MTILVVQVIDRDLRLGKYKAAEFQPEDEPGKKTIAGLI
jgi:hypothetical protein